MSGKAAATSGYWDVRARQFAHRGRGLRAVCSFGMPPFYNGYIDLVQRRALAPWLRVGAGTRVLEIGCGVGRWTRRLARRGAEVTATDLSPAMLAEAQRRTEATRFGTRCRFLVADASELTLDGQFDRILCVTVLQHILDAQRLDSAIRRLADHLTPRGRIVLLEVAPMADDPRCNSSTFVARTEEQYRELFARAGLVCVTTRGVDPCRLKTWFLPHYRRLPRLAANCGLFAVTALSLPYDFLASRLARRRSWHKVFVLAREAV